MKLDGSPVTDFCFLGRHWFVKRDDLLDERISGNKARKLYKFATNGFGTKKVLSYGGAQSNAMYSISALAKAQNIEFEYYTKELPKILRNVPVGNLRAALANGMKLIEIPHAKYDAKIEELLDSKDEDMTLIRQGGADLYAREGLKVLANEITEFANAKGLSNPIVITSSGTGTTAGYLSDYLRFECVTVPAVSDGAFLDREFDRLGVTKKPTVLETSDKIAFASPHPKLIGIYRELLAAGLEFDLIYDAKCWLAVSENMEFFENKDVIFVHSGGVLGNETQLARYAHKGF